MAVDINQSFQDVKGKISSLNKYNQLRDSYNERLNSASNNFQKKSEQVQINIDSAKKAREIKQKFTSSFDQLVEMLQTVDEEDAARQGKRTTNKLIEILKNTLQELPSIAEQILTEEIINSEGCSLDQTYPSNQEIFIPISKIDIFKQLQFDPDSQLGFSIYEKRPYTGQDMPSPKSTNRFFYQVIQGNGLVFQYNGASGQPLFNISYETFNGVEQGNYFKVILLDRLNSPNLISSFLVDYYKSLKLLDFNNAVTKIVDLILNTFSVNAGTGPVTLNDEKRFYIIIQRILGMCFDYTNEIDVGGIAKYPEYDDTTDTLFEFTDNELSLIENEIDLIRRGVVEFVDCNNIILPVTDTGYVSDVISETNEDGSNVDEVLQNVFFNLSNDIRWELQLPQIFNASYNNDIIKNFVNGAVSSILSPKVIFPQFVVAQSILISSSQVGTNIINDFTNEFPGAMSFARNNKKFIINTISRISAVFIESLFNELRKDLLKLAENIVLDIIQKKLSYNKKLFQSVLNNLNQIKLVAQGTKNFISDYRQCKSLLNYIFNLLSIGGIRTLKTGQEDVPTPILLLARTLSGSNPDRELINYIEQMQKLGLPVGTGINGEPDLSTISTYAVMNAIFDERAANGKVEGVAYTETIAPTGQPTGVVRIIGKSI